MLRNVLLSSLFFVSGFAIGQHLVASTYDYLEDDVINLAVVSFIEGCASGVYMVDPSKAAVRDCVDMSESFRVALEEALK